MKKSGWVIGAVLLLSACGSQETRMPVALGELVTPASAPWLQVDQTARNVQVRGLDDPLTLEPTPPVPEVVQSRLRRALQPAYFTDLVVQCGEVASEMRVDADATPASVTLELGLHCTINARGLISAQDYHAQPSMRVPADGNYAKALSALLATGSDEIAGRLRSDVQASLQR
ncbi:hypothetical protein [Fulvimonas yonginensis]|uniref:Lipoprotein n=1 Tax=Fulvimonas yonginensis TaxID=1495200 RepID=A0ABU8JGW2_9GAMM